MTIDLMTGPAGRLVAFVLDLGAAIGSYWVRRLRRRGSPELPPPPQTR